MNKAKTQLVLIVTVAALTCTAFAAPQQRGTNGSRRSQPDTESLIDARAYRLGPEDLIAVFVWREEDVSTEVVVRPDGKISLPLVGEIEAAGKTPVELQEEITSALSAYLANPVVNVVVTEINSRKVSVLGEVNKPGRYVMRQKTTVLDAIALAEGFTEWAKRDDVVIIREDANGRVERLQLNLDRLLSGRERAAFELRPNDVVYVR